MDYSTVEQQSLHEFDDVMEMENNSEYDGAEDLEGGGDKNYHWTPSLIKKRGYNTLQQIARDGHMEELEDYLMSSNFYHGHLDSLDDKQNSALHYASRYSHLKVVETLLAPELNIKVDNIGSDGMTPLHYATRYGKNVVGGCEADDYSEEMDVGLGVVKLLVENGADYNKQDDYSLTPLHHASMRGYVKVVEFLLGLDNINIDSRDKQGSTALHIAATYRNQMITQLLLGGNASVRIQDKQRQTPLHRAAQEGDSQIIQLMLESMEPEDKESAIGEEDSDGSTPLTLAVQAGNCEAVEVYMQDTDCSESINSKNYQGESPIHFASRSGDTDTISLLLDNGARIDETNSMNQTPLYLAAANAKDNAKYAKFHSQDHENVDVVKMLIDRGSDINKWDIDGFTPVMIAGQKGHYNVVKLLVHSGARLDIQDKNDNTFFHICAEHGQHKIIKMVIQEKEEAISLLTTNDQYDNTPLHLAAESGQVETVRELLHRKYKIEVDNKNEDESTPCHLAARNGHVEVLKLLLQKDPNAIFDKDEDDNTPLHLAAANRHSEAVKFLLDQGASVHKRNAKKWTPLDCAAAEGSYKAAELLLENDSPVDPQDRRNITPLHLAAIYGHDRTAQLLLSYGACLGLENFEGKNALELAISNRHRNVVETIIANKNWRIAMRSVNVIKTSRQEFIPDTPMRMLIRTYPELAEEVFDKCIKSGSNSVEMDFEFLEDTFSLNKKVKPSGRTVYYYDDLNEDNMKPYDESGTLNMINHPLMIMVEEKQKHLLKHPLCLALLRRKWMMFGRYVFYIQLVLYLLFLVSLTSYIMMHLNKENFPSSKTNGTECTVDFFGSDSHGENVFKVLVILFSILNIIIEFSQMIRMKGRYFQFYNLVDWVVYLLAILFVFDFCIHYDFHWDGCKGLKCWQWPVGSFLVTVIWLNFLAYFQHVPFFGIFILMFKDISKTAFNFLLILFIFLIGFGLGFHILFINHLAFDTPSWALAKTYVMMIGEFEFEGMFTEHDDPDKDSTENAESAKLIPFPKYSTVLFVVFVFVMSIIVSNLLVGLAVDDIKEIQDHAEREKLSMQVQLVLETERFLPHLKCCLSHNFLFNYMQPKEVVSLVKSNCFKVKDVLTKSMILEYLKQRSKGPGRENAVDDILVKQHEMERTLKTLTSSLKYLTEENTKLIDLMAKS